MRKLTFLLLLITFVTFNTNGQSNLFSESFSTGSLPPGWTNVDNTGNNAGTWLFDNPGNRTINTTTGASGFAIFDSDKLGSDGIDEDADLITPAIDCSTLSEVVLSFEHYYYGYSNSVARVFVSGDNGATWTSLESWSTSSTNNAAVAKYDISSVAAGKSEVKIKWNFQGEYAYYWAIDDVMVRTSINDLSVQSINVESEVFTNVAVSPTVTIENTGEFSEDSYSVTLSDGNTYSETVDVTDIISPENTNEITFPDWTPTQEGTNTLTATVVCTDDANADNDVSTIQVTASPREHDMGISLINVDSQVYSNEAVSPTVTIRNLGDYDESPYSIILSDGNDYNETVDITDLLIMNDGNNVTFPDWTPILEGIYTLTATVVCTDDAIVDNNILTKQVSASQQEHDLSVQSINVDSEVLSSDIISPTVTIENLGEYDESSYSIILSDGKDYNETVDITDLLVMNDNNNVTFPDWAPAAGNYTLTATITLVDDVDGHNNSLNKEIDVSDPIHDLAVFAVPNAIASGTTATPYVTIINNGDYSEASYTVSLSNGSAYNETVSEITSIDVGSSLQVTFPDWTPADGIYTLTAIVTLTDDANTDNNTLIQECKTVTERMAYISRYSSGSVNGTLNIPFDIFTEIGRSSSQIQSLGWKDNCLYAITYDGLFGTMNTTDGSFTLIGSTGISANYYTSLICDPITNQMYVTTLTGSYPDFNIGLYSINQETGTGTLVATSPQTGTFSQFAFDGDGQLYTIEHLSTGKNGLFYSVDKMTAEMTLIGDLGGVVSSNFQPMSWDVYSEVMYFQASGNMQGSYVINLNTGATTLVGTPYANQVLAMVLPIWDANLSSLSVDGTAITDFSPGVYTYDVVLPSGSTELPVLGASAFYSSSTTVITDVTALPGSATVVVTTPEGQTNTYTVDFTVAEDSDVSLSDLLIDGITVENFNSSILTYNIVYPTGTSIVPTVSATAADANATFVVTQATEFPGISTVLITAADGITQQTYTVNFSVTPNTDATLSGILVDGIMISDFDPSTLTYNVSLPLTTSTIPTVTAIMNDANATMEIINTEALPGTTSVVVTAEDGITQQTYTVNFSVSANTDATLSGILVDGVTISDFDPSTLTYNVILPSTTSTIPTVTATTNDANATMEVINAEALPGTTDVIVTAEDESTQETYTINFSVIANNDATLSDLKVKGITVADFNPATLTYNVVLPSGTNTVPMVTAITYDSNATEVVIQATELPSTSTTVVTAADGVSQQTYTINLSVAVLDDATLADLKVDGETIVGFDPSTLTYEVVLPSGTTDIPELTATTTDSRALITEINNATSFSEAATIVVEANDGITTLTYTVTYTIASTNAFLSTLAVDDSRVDEFSSSIYSYDVELPYGTTLVPTVTATPADANASKQISPAASLPGATTVLVTAEYGNSLIYTVNFTKAPALTDATLSDLAVDGNTVSNFSASTYTYNVELPYGTTVVPTVTAIVTDATASKQITEATDLPGSTTVLVTAQDGTTILTYTVNFTETPALTDATLSDLAVDGNTVSNFLASTYTYNVELPYGITVVPTVTAIVTDATASKQITEATDLPGSTTVLVTAQDGTTTLTYTVNFFNLTTGIDKLDEQELIIYPNPAVHTIKIKADTDIAKVQIYSVQGVMVLSQNFNNNSVTINVNNLNTGIYIIKIKTDKGITTKRFVKQ